MSCAPSLSCSIVPAPSFSHSFHSLAILDQLKEDFCGLFLTIVFIFSDFLVFCSGFLVISSILTFNYWFLYFAYFMMANSQELFLTLWSLCRLLILFYECNIFYYVTGDIICNLLEFCSASGLTVSSFTFPLFFLTVYLVLAVPGPRWCAGTSLLVESRATLRLWCRPLPEVASAAGEHRLQWLPCEGSAAAVCWALSADSNSSGSRACGSAARQVLLGQRPNPCLMHWQADSPLSHPQLFIFFFCYGGRLIRKGLT